MGVPIVHRLPDYWVVEEGEMVESELKGRPSTEKQPSESEGFQAVAISLGHLGRVMLDLLNTGPCEDRLDDLFREAKEWLGGHREVELGDGSGTREEDGRVVSLDHQGRCTRA